MAARPKHLLYALDDVPPPGLLFGLALQHVAQIAIFLIVAVTIARMARLSPDASLALLSGTLVVGGIASALQSLRRWGIGSGYLVPATTTTILLPPAALAASIGGLPMVMGVTAVAGVVVVLVSFLITRLRPVFPPEIAGFVVFMVGVSVLVLSMGGFLGVGGERAGVPADAGAVMLAAGTLGIMVALNIWGSARLRLFCALIGIVAGYVVAVLTNAMDPEKLQAIADAPMFDPLPIRLPGLAFSLDLLVPTVIAGVAIALNGIGAMTAAQRVNDADWKRPDFEPIRRGVFAEGLVNIVAGLVGGGGQAATSGAVGLSEATGATSRVIGFAIGAIMVVLAFLPGVGAVLLAMPEPVIGAALTFSGSFLIVNGIRMIAARMLDARKVFVLGIAFAFGLARSVYPEAFADAPGWLAPWVSSSMSIAVCLAILLNLLFRFGIHQRSSTAVDTDAYRAEALADFLEEQGALWGAQPEVVYRARFAASETIEALVSNGMVFDTVRLSERFPHVRVPGGTIGIETRFDEFRFDVRIVYRGALIEPRADRPTDEEILASDEGMLELARYMIGRSADTVRAERREDLCVVTLSLAT